MCKERAVIEVLKMSLSLLFNEIFFANNFRAIQIVGWKKILDDDDDDEVEVDLGTFFLLLIFKAFAKIKLFECHFVVVRWEAYKHEFCCLNNAKKWVCKILRTISLSKVKAWLRI